MGKIRDVIVSGVKQCRENGIEPNRIRMGHATYYDFIGEMAAEKDSPITDWSEIASLVVEVWLTCPRYAIYVDRKPEDEDIGELETRLRARGVEPNRVRLSPKIEEIAPALTRILLTAERVEAIKEAIETCKAFAVEYDTKRLNKTIAILKEMIADA